MDKEIGGFRKIADASTGSSSHPTLPSVPCRFWQHESCQSNSTIVRLFGTEAVAVIARGGGSRDRD